MFELMYTEVTALMVAEPKRREKGEISAEIILLFVAYVQRGDDGIVGRSVPPA